MYQCLWQPLCLFPLRVQEINAWKRMFYICSKFQKQFSGRNFWLYNWWSGYMTPIFIFTKAFFKKSTFFVDWKWCVLNGFIFFLFDCYKKFPLHGINPLKPQTVVDNIIRENKHVLRKMRYLGIQCIYVFLVCDVSLRTVWSDSWVSEEKLEFLSAAGWVKTEHNKVHLAWFPERSKKLFFLWTRPSLYWTCLL